MSYQEAQHNCNNSNNAKNKAQAVDADLKFRRHQCCPIREKTSA